MSDLADIHLISAKHLINNGKSNIFNCGYGKGYSVKEVIENFNQILDKKISYEIGPRRDGDSKMIIANPEKLINSLVGNQNLIILNIYLKLQLIGKKIK